MIFSNRLPSITVKAIATSDGVMDEGLGAVRFVRGDSFLDCEGGPIKKNHRVSDFVELVHSDPHCLGHRPGSQFL